MNAPIVFMDTETTGLELDDHIWEFAAIRRDPDGSESELHLFVQHDQAKCAHLPTAFLQDHVKRWPGNEYAVDPGNAAAMMWAITNGAHIVGAVPNFDTERIARLLGNIAGIPPKWHYHLIDVENLAVGYLAGLSGHGHSEVTCGPLCGQGGAERPPAPPWDSDDLSRAIGVEPPGEGVRHTAMGDVRWARAVYDAVMGGQR